MTSNGYLVVGGADRSQGDVQFIPALGNTDRPNGVLAPFWTDLDGTDAPGIFADTLRDGVDNWLVVEWRLNVFGTTSLRTFQVWIGLNGIEDITYAYDPAKLPGNPFGFEFVVGAENLDGTSAASIADLPIEDLRVTSDPVPPNSAPVAQDDAFTTDEDTPLDVAAPGVLGNDTDADGDALSAALVSGAQHGSVALNADGSFHYTPAADYNGPDSFTYGANDGSADSSTATVSITVEAANDASTAVDDA